MVIKYKRVCDNTKYVIINTNLKSLNQTLVVHYNNDDDQTLLAKRSNTITVKDFQIIKTPNKDYWEHDFENGWQVCQVSPKVYVFYKVFRCGIQSINKLNRRFIFIPPVCSV